MKPRFLMLATAALAAPIAPAVFAQTAAPPVEEQTIAPEEEDDLGQIVVTGSMRVRQGGAQNIGHSRSLAADGGIPRPESLTVEGLMGDHDLALPSPRACPRLFCLVTEAMAASLPARPADRFFVGLGFASNVDDKLWRRDPLNLVAVVDKSGSMDGEPLALVRQSLRKIVGQLRDGDQISIVLYGDTSHLYLPPVAIRTGRAQALAAIDRIRSAGSTNMEEGLQVGYDTAYGTQAAFKGATRLMLFTDEQPNVGATDPASFIGMAQAASRRRIGLTTIGVGVQFDAELATKVSSARGGNLYFIADAAEVKSVFDAQLDTMVSEIAHDVKITMTPRDGFKIAGVFGVPDGLMTSNGDGAVTVTVPTAFFSTHGGGIFASLAKADARAELPVTRMAQGDPLMAVDLSYVGAKDQRRGSDRVTVAGPAEAASQPLRLAHLLVDEFLTLRDATTAYHAAGDPKTAFRLLSGFDGRLKASGIGGLKAETKLVGELLDKTAFFAGYRGERPASLRHLAVGGTWEVRSVSGFDDVRQGDRWAFNDDNELVMTRKWSKERDVESETYKINARQVYLTESGFVLDYGVRGDQLTMTDSTGLSKLVLKRVAANATP